MTPPAAEQSSSAIAVHGCVVLVVEDNPVNMRVARMALERGGSAVVEAETAEHALALLEGTRPDLILLDVELPGMDGYALCERLQQRPELAEIPVIFATAREGEEDKARALALGAVDYLVKPLKTSLLQEKVREHVGARRRWQETVASVTASVDGAAWTPDFAGFRRALAQAHDASPEQISRLDALKAKQLYDAAAVLSLAPERLARQVATFLRLPFVEVVDVGRLALGVLPTAFCKTNQVIAIEVPDGGHGFVLANPFDRDLVHLLHTWKKHTNLSLAVTPPANIASLFDAEAAAPTERAPDDLNALTGFAEHGSQDAPALEHVNEDSPPILRLVNQLVENAHALGASDVHIEPGPTDLLVRYRIDGTLREVHRFGNPNLIRPLVSRIKVMANLDIVERRLPQDGRIEFRRFSASGEDIDLRVATAPMQFGEKVVLRVLDKRKAVLPLPDLGFSQGHLDRYRSKLHAPEGMILHVGPTGSGKSMTLYAALNELRSPDINIQTAEDPIEYQLPGINQLQVHPEIGLTFARALRSYLRQDPDVILVGEIRDRETAGIAVEAALTGHLLLSTLHTRDAASTVVRLVEMGIEPYLLSSSLLVVCAQRLLRRLCKECKEPYQATEAECRLVGAEPGSGLTLYKPNGCEACTFAGTRGRIGVHELLVPGERLRKAIVEPGMTSERLKEMAVRESGMTTLYWDAMAKVRAGICWLQDALADITQDEFDSNPERFVAAAAQGAPSAPGPGD